MVRVARNHSVANAPLYENCHQKHKYINRSLYVYEYFVVFNMYVNADGNTAAAEIVNIEA